MADEWVPTQLYERRNSCSKTAFVNERTCMVRWQRGPPPPVVVPDGTCTQPTENTCHQEFVYEHPFELVYRSYMTRFPRCPDIPELRDCIISEREEMGPDCACEQFMRRTVLSSDDIPWLIRKATGVDSIEFDSLCTVDWARRIYTIKSQNLTMRKKLTIDEVSVCCVPCFHLNWR